MSLDENDTYKMTSEPRGFCVIINIINFDQDQYEERSDSIDNVYLIKKTFEQLSFTVKILINLSDVELKQKLVSLINSEECNSHDAFVLYIHSHGDQNGFVTANNKVIQFHQIINLLSIAKN